MELKRTTEGTKAAARHEELMLSSHNLFQRIRQELVEITKEMIRLRNTYRVHDIFDNVKESVRQRTQTLFYLFETHDSNYGYLLGGAQTDQPLIDNQLITDLIQPPISKE
jgi:hypothetical protein